MSLVSIAARSPTGCRRPVAGLCTLGSARWALHVVHHPERQLWHYGLEEKPKYQFRVLPRRWGVERTFAWLGQSRRLSKDYERLPSVSEAMIYGAMSRLILRRLTRTAA
jgi:transposase